MPPDPQQGSNTVPCSGASIATSTRTMLTGVKYS
jgi:hypothetical protein